MVMTYLNEMMNSTFVRIKVVAFVHFFFISNAMLGSWGHGAYEFYNFFFLITMLWSIHSKDSVEAVQAALVIDACSIFFDLVSIIILFHAMNGWAVSFSIINFLVRPLSIILLVHEFNARYGNVQTGSVFPANNRYPNANNSKQMGTTTSPSGPNVASIF